ncbi:integrin alpha-M-like isoform X2 [Engystomops pustulosus]|uniref:integrin alpha-M-like isoform X2 n=1 Tax=Engystomops pustulosus TaxID=76066 RepID=UPI003AFA920E
MGAPLCCSLLIQVLSLAGASFLDTEQPIIFRGSDPSFGHQVIQLGKRVIISAPRHQEAINKTGSIYHCNPGTTQCSPIRISESDEDINISLGLSLASLENTGQLLACGPTLQRTCGQNIYVNGRCFQLDQNLRQQGNLSAPPPECGLDIVFVVDGSGSVGPRNFVTVLRFVRQMIDSLSKADTRFAFLQYSSDMKVEFTFRRFSSASDLTVVDKVGYQYGGATRTQTAILKAVEDLFVPLSREDARKLLIVITDGESNDKAITFQEATSKADEHGIQRISIGVGESFSKGKAYAELRTIASSDDNIFQVNDFSALDEIQKRLQQKIFAIEGTQSQSGQSFQTEFSQEGFSAILTPDGALLGAVGAYGWTGGAYIYRTGQMKPSWINITTSAGDMEDSYLGYSLLQIGADLMAMGAPRYQHTGKVFVFRRDPRSGQWAPAASALGEQIGSYFGSALSVLQKSPSQHLLVVGAPTYYSPVGPGGRVYLCLLSQMSRTPSTFACPETLQGESSQSMGLFGSAVTVLPDLTGDQYPELAVGAPYEDNGQGAVYIFPGKDGGFRTSYIQRVAGGLLRGGAQLFGRSLAGNSDMMSDGLPDIVAGGEGVTVVLSSRPVLEVSASMTFTPNFFPLSSYDCAEKTQEQKTEINVCFKKRVKSKGARAGTSVLVQYTLVLDAGRTQNRAVFTDLPTPDLRTISSSQDLKGRKECLSYRMILPECVEDSLTPLRVSLNFSLIGNAVLSEDSRTNHSAEVSFEKNCGADGRCVDDLSMSVSFSGLQQLVVGLSLDVNLTVSVTNKGDESYNTRVLIPFPLGLSYRRVSLIQSNKRVTITCSTEESQRVVSCGVNRPLLRSNTTVIFLVSFHVVPSADLGGSLTLSGNVTSDNGTPFKELMRSSATIKVRYSIYVTVTSLEESSKYENYTSPEPRIQHVYRVKNQGVHQPPLSVIFLIPIRLGESVIWETPNITSSKPQLTRCNTISEAKGPANYQELLTTKPVLNCVVTSCLRAVCDISNLKYEESVTFTISGTVTKAWENQVEQEKISLQSSAEIQYEPQMYYMEQNFTRAQAQTVLEVNVQYNYLPVIIGSSVGGLVLLALITAALYKFGFFKRHYKEMLENTGGEGAGDGTAVDPQVNGGPE